MAAMRMAQYGTKHGHAAGKLAALQSNPDVELVGVWEPDPQRRRDLEAANGPYRDVHWFRDAAEMLEDRSIVAIASEGRNDESLGQTEETVRADKHVWYDKPAGDSWDHWQRVTALAAERNVHIQMGYMFRSHAGFQRIAEWACSGLLGKIFAVRAHMSTHLSPPEREVISRHAGGIFYDLAGHMLDQIVWLLGRPHAVTAFLRNDSGIVPSFSDNTLGVFEFEQAGTIWLDAELHFAEAPSEVEEAFITWLDVETNGATALLHGARHDLQLVIEAPEGASFELEELREQSEANAKNDVLKRLRFVLPAATEAQARVRMEILPRGAT
jgi:predicted dehydrogenase